MRSVTLAFLVVLAAAAPAAAVSVSVDHDAQADFARYHTYSLSAGTPAANPLNQKRIDAALEAQLAAKGLTKAAEDADVRVVTHVASEKSTQVRVDTFGYGYYPGYRWYRGPAHVDTTVQTYDIVQGTLVVDMVDAATNQLVWRGTATDTVSPTIKPEKVEKLIQKAVEKLFRKYPPE